MNMTDFIPGMSWVKLAGAAVLIGGVAAGGWVARGYVDSAPIAAAKMGEAGAKQARAEDSARTNAAASEGLAKSGANATRADDDTATRGALRADGYNQAMENANAPTPTPRPDTPVDVRPLRLLFVGMQHADAAAGTAGADQAGVSEAAQHDLPAAGGHSGQVSGER